MQNKKQKSEAHDAPAPKSLRLAWSAADAQKALNPACPGVIKTRPKTCLVKLPHQDAYEVFKKLKADGNFEYEEAWLKLITCYDDADMNTAEEILSGMYSEFNLRCFWLTLLQGKGLGHHSRQSPMIRLCHMCFSIQKRRAMVSSGFTFMDPAYHTQYSTSFWTMRISLSKDRGHLRPTILRRHDQEL